MSSFQRGCEKRRAFDEYHSEEELFGSVASPAGSLSPDAPKGHDQEKRLRREIANSNERRRMQSINAGFQSLKALLPQSDGEKLSKAAILQQTSDYISSLEQEKQHLLSQNSQLKRMLTGMDVGNVVPKTELVKTEPNSHTSPPPKRKKRDTESSDEGIVLSSGDNDEPSSYDDLRRELLRLRTQLEAERCLRMRLEQQCRVPEDEEPVKEQMETVGCLASQVQAPIKHREHWKQRHYIEEQQKALHTEVEKKPPMEVVPNACETETSAHSSMSRRNLETIVEAIRHLEGDSMLLDVYRKSDELTPSDDGEEKDLSRLSGADHSDDKSDSGHDSPPHGDNMPHHNLSPRYLVRPTSTPGIGTVTASAASVKIDQPFLAAERYPVAAAHLLHSSFPAQFAQRPAVIVSNLS